MARSIRNARTSLPIAFWLLLVSAQAQSRTDVAVNLGIGIAGPGELASVPVTFSELERGRVEKIFFTVSFHGKLVAYRSSSAKGRSELPQVVIKVESLQQEEERLLRVELFSPDGIPPGTTAELRFDVSKEARPNDEIDLRIVQPRVQTGESELLEARGSDGLITVAALGGVIPACFFYMH